MIRGHAVIYLLTQKLYEILKDIRFNIYGENFVKHDSSNELASTIQLFP